MAKLLLVVLVVALLAWPISHFGGEQALLYAVMALPLASMLVILAHHRRLAREDAVVSELVFADQRLELRQPGGLGFVAPRSGVQVMPRVYLAGGRTVMRLPCVELLFEQQRLAVVLADPTQRWPEARPECDVAPEYLIATQDWPAFLHALDVPPTTST